MAKKRKRPASRGSVNKVIMQTLLGGQKYGLEIIKEIEEETAGKVIIKQPSLYSALSRFKAKGYVTSFWEDSPLGGKRHYYSLTTLGHEYYRETFTNDDADDDDNDNDEELVSQPALSVDTESKELKTAESNQHQQNRKTENQSQELKMEFDANKSTKPSDDEIAEKSDDSFSNTTITSDNFHSHIQNKIKKLLEENGTDNADDINEPNLTETTVSSTQQADITQSKDESVSYEPTNSNLTETTITDDNTHEHADMEIVTNNQSSIEEELADDVDAEEVEIAEEISENSIHIQPITALNSYREFSMDNDETEEISDRLKGLKNLYNEIKTQTTKIEQATKNKKPTLNKPLSLIERQKREASMQKLYGQTLELYNQQDPSASKLAGKSLLQTDAMFPTLPQPQQHLDDNATTESQPNTPLTKSAAFNLAEHSRVFHISPRQTAATQNDVASVDKKTFTVDENGIMKLDDNSKTSGKFNKVIDNVVFRSNNYGNNVSAIKATTPPPTISKTTRPAGSIAQQQKTTAAHPVKKAVPLSPAEREERLKQFDKRFESLTNSQIEKKKKALSTLNILESLYKKDKPTSLYAEPSPPKQPSAAATNTTTIQQTPAYKRPLKSVPSYPTEQDVDFDYEDDPIVFEGKLDVAPKEKFLNKKMHMKFQQANKKAAVNSQPIISENQSNQKPNSILNLQREMQEKNLLFKTYSNEDFSNQPDVKFLLSNKIKFAMGWIFLLLMLVELTAFVFILQSNGMLYVNDYIVLQSAYAVVLAVALLNILPFIFNKNKRKANNFKFSYSLFLGVFALALVAVMAYAISTFMGMNMQNINFFLVKLITPLILAVNFIIAPVIYKLLLNRKTFY